MDLVARVDLVEEEAPLTHGQNAILDRTQTTMAILNIKMIIHTIQIQVAQVAHQVNVEKMVLPFLQMEQMEKTET